jgi:hypothetical protein
LTASITFLRVASLKRAPELPLRIRDTVACDTPARAATSIIVGFKAFSMMRAMAPPNFTST